MAFGLIPSFGLSVNGEQWGFFLAYFVSGFLGALAENGTTILLTNKFKDRLGAVTASIGTACGVGCLAGPPLGGFLYDLPKLFLHNPHGTAQRNAEIENWCFRSPFIIVGLATLGLAALVFVYFSDVRARGESKEPPSSMLELLDLSRTVTLVAIALSGTVVATLDPTLANKLYQDPYYYTPSGTGMVFMASSITYIVLSIPIGWAVDIGSSLPPLIASARCKWIQAGGFLILFLSFFLLGPFELYGNPKDLSLEVDVPPGVVSNATVGTWATYASATNLSKFTGGMLSVSLLADYRANPEVVQVDPTILRIYFARDISPPSTAIAASLQTYWNSTGGSAGAPCLMNGTTVQPEEEPRPTPISNALETPAILWLAMLLKGVGSAGNNAGYPDLAIGIADEDEGRQAALAGLWNAAYAVGWAAGPIVGGGLVQACEFSGFATVVSMASLVYAIILAFASGCRGCSHTSPRGYNPVPDAGGSEMGEGKGGAQVASAAPAGGTIRPAFADRDGINVGVAGNAVGAITFDTDQLLGFAA